MFIPLTIAIFRGALSPASPAGKDLGAGKLQQAIRRLRLLPDSAEGIATLLRQVLEECGIDIELPSPRFFPSFRYLQRSGDTALLCHLRTDEMEYALHLSYCDTLSTARNSFYDALLAAESRWLRLLLREEMARMQADDDARLLLCEALDEIYVTGAEADEAARRGFMPEVCLQLKGALASLYLGLTVDFGYLLQPVDYLDYRTLLSDARYLHSIDEREAWEYEVCQTGNEAIGLVASENAAGRRQEALHLYGRMEELCAGMGELTVLSPLCRRMILLENFLFCLYCESLPDKGKCARKLFDPEETARLAIDLRDNCYSGHLGSTEGRSAGCCVQKYLDESCFAFLSPRLGGEGSIPRMLRAYLLRCKELYEENYARPFIAVRPDTALTTVSVAAAGVGNPLPGEIHALLGFLDRMTAKADRNTGRGKRGTGKERKPTPAKLLENLFFTFLCNGEINADYCKSVVICAGRREVVYGAIFHYQEKRGGRREDYAKFLLTVCADADTKLETMVSNVGRYKDAYEEYAAEQNLKLWA